jgi:hypothetical protein
MVAFMAGHRINPTGSMNIQVEIDPPYQERSGQFIYATDRVPFVDMATAISRIYVDAGFTVAADGRELHTETGSVSSNSEQKIFGLHHRSGHLACAVTGTGRIGENYRLSQELPKLAAGLEGLEALSVGEYAERLGNGLKQSIDKRFSWVKKSVTINLLLDGYIDGEPGRAKVTIVCGSTPVAVMVEESPNLFPGMAIGFGSKLIHSLLFAETLQHETLRPYWTVCRQEVRTLDQAEAVAHAIVEAQCDERVAVLDHEHCSSIGGHIHIAEITANGFKWRTPPLCASTDP